MELELQLEQTKLRLIETQLALLQYQHRDVAARIQELSQPMPDGSGNTCEGSLA